MPLLGRAALILTLGLLVYAAVAGACAARIRSRRLEESARNGFLAAFGTTLVASLVLLVSLLRHDFSLVYVARNTSRELPLLYTVGAFWSGQSGSLLLWLLVLTGMGSAAVLLNRRLLVDALPWTVPVLAAIASFFAFVPVFVSSPFATQVAPADGAGMSAVLQNRYMISHPPLLYLGYVGLAIPFAFAMAALLSGRVDERWLVAVRRWTLASWMFLGLAILVGAKWAYETIGWGGYYGWDPVENAALMPWLVSTAFLHSVIVQEKRDMLRVWNVVLVSLAFCLSLFGTFLTRSGVINSIHSFTQSPIAGWLLGFIAVVVTGTTALIMVRLPLLRSRAPRLESLVSREAAFLYNNLLLVGFALTILWGVTYPLLSQALRGTRMTIGPPYYDFFLAFFGLPLLLLMGIGPLLAWRGSSPRSLARTLLWPAAVAAGAAGILALAGAGSSPRGVAAYTFALFALAAVAQEFMRGTRARRRSCGEGWAEAFAELVARNRRRYGGYVVHLAIVLLAIGVVGSNAYRASRSQHLQPGQSMSVGGYTLTYAGAFQQSAPSRDELRARLLVWRDGRQSGTIEPGKNRYRVEGALANEVAIRTDWLRAEDLFVVATQFSKDGSVDLRVVVNPLVDLIWIAGLVMLAGSLVSLWPDGREQRRLARRAVELRTLVKA